MDDGQVGEAEAEARIFLQAGGEIVADHKQQIVNGVGNSSKTNLCSLNHYWQIFSRTPLG